MGNDDFPTGLGVIVGAAVLGALVLAGLVTGLLLSSAVTLPAP